MAINNVCRLCMSDKELIWLFDQRFGECGKNMKNVVMVTTGVEVLEKDVISQNICNNCCKLTVKMFEFRERAVKTDQYLKNQCKELLVGSDITLKIPNTSVSITKEKKIDKCKLDLVPMTNQFTIKLLPSTCKKSEVTKPTNIKSENPIEVLKQHKKNIHSSINQIFSKYADIKIPTGCLKFDVSPVVSMEMNNVEEYFKRKNIDMKKHVQMVLRPMRASKKTLAVNFSKKYQENAILFVEQDKPGTSKCLDSPESIKLADAINKRKSDDNVVNKTSSVKKIKLSSNSEPIHPTLMETLQLKPNENLLIHRCSVCNVPQISAKTLKKHYRTHFICSYCKSKFRLVERKENHEKTCAIKLALTCQSYVNLERVDLTEYKLNTFKVAASDEMIFSFQETHKTNKDEIIELSDDEDSTTVLSSGLVNNTLQVPASTPNLVEQHPVTEPIQYISTAIVKPCIKIIDNHVLNTIDTSSTDMKVLKQIITQTGTNNLKLTVDGETQTTLPSNEQIVQNTLYGTAELKNLLPELKMFKIPIEIKHGKFNVSYNKNKQEEKKRDVKPWNRLKPVDVTGINSTKMKFNLKTRLAKDISLFAKTPKAKILNYSLIKETQPSQKIANFRLQAPQTSNTPLTSNVQMHNLPQLTNNDPKQFLTNPGQNTTSPIVQSSNGQFQNVPQLSYPGPSYHIPNFASNARTYFIQSNGDVSSQITNNTNSNNRGFVNTNTNMQQNMNSLPLPLNHMLSLHNPTMPNLIPINPSTTINTIPLPFSTRKTPPPNVNLFSSHVGTDLVSNSNIVCSTKVNNSKEPSVNKPLIRVKNLCDLT